MTQQPLQSAPASVSASFAPAPIVLGTEFGPVSTAAEGGAIGLPARENAPLLIVHAIDPGRLRLPGGRFRQRVDQAHAARETDAAALIQRVRAAGVVPQLLIWDGDAATCI